MCFTAISCYDVSEVEKDRNDPNQVNTTKLYPVNDTVDDIKTKQRKSGEIRETSQEIKHNTDLSDEIITLSNNYNDNSAQSQDSASTENNDNGRIIAKEVNLNNYGESIGTKNEITTWSIESNYTQVDKETTQDTNQTNVKYDRKNKGTNNIKEFRPSPHLGSFLDEDTFVLPTQPTLGLSNAPFRPTAGFISSSPDFYKLNYKKPIDAPYKFETNGFHKPFWKQGAGLESKPTAQVPVKIPAGGLYKSPEILKDPSLGSNEEYRIKLNDEPKLTPLKKGVNPWKGLLHLATALLPVGLIVSALTPNIITVQPSSTNPYFPMRFNRRVEGFKNLPHISEECKRRLLCELHSGDYTGYQGSSGGHKHCYRLPCEDPQAMMKVLRWVITHRPLNNYQHGDNRGRFI